MIAMNAMMSIRMTCCLQARLSDLEASCRSISLLGTTITDSAAKLADLAQLHQQLACSVEGVRGMVVKQQDLAVQQQEILAIVASAAATRAMEGPAVQDAVVQTDTLWEPARPEPQLGPNNIPFSYAQSESFVLLMWLTAGSS